MAAQEGTITLMGTVGEGSITFDSKLTNLTNIANFHAITNDRVIRIDAADCLTLQKIKEWTEMHNYSPPAYEEPVKPVYPKSWINKDKTMISEKDLEFLDKTELKMITKMIKVAETMSYTSLYILCSRYLAKKMKGKNAAGIREMFKPVMIELGCFQDDETGQASPQRLRIDTSAPGPSGMRS